jgi:hypothetical protein
VTAGRQLHGSDFWHKPYEFGLKVRVATTLRRGPMPSRRSFATSDALMMKPQPTVPPPMPAIPPCLFRQSRGTVG